VVTVLPNKQHTGHFAHRGWGWPKNTWKPFLWACCGWKLCFCH